jgi:hypothetical protein
VEARRTGAPVLVADREHVVLEVTGRGRDPVFVELGAVTAAQLAATLLEAVERLSPDPRA